MGRINWASQRRASFYESFIGSVIRVEVCIWIACTRENSFFYAIYRMLAFGAIVLFLDAGVS